jgi:hypothetical protein
MTLRKKLDYNIQVREDEYGTNSSDDNVDVTVEFANGERYVATVFTINNLRTLMRRYRESGECANGLYVWATRMIVMEQISRRAIEEMVKDLIESEEFASAFDGPLSND